MDIPADSRIFKANLICLGLELIMDEGLICFSYNPGVE